MGIRRALGRVILVGAVLYGLTVAAITGYSLWQSNPASPPQADMIVCLGAGVDSNGVPGPLAIARAKSCAWLYAQGAAPLILFTGGNADRSALSGGAAMADVAISAGVPEHTILIEHDSQSTLQNALFSRPFIGDADHIIIVTDAFHMPRSLASFRAMGDWSLSSWTSDRVRPLPFGDSKSRMIHREALAIWFNLARFTAWRSATALGVTSIDDWLY